MIDTNNLVDWYLAQNNTWRQRDQGHTLTGWRSSSLGYCQRKQMYSRLGIPAFRELDATTLRTFSYGDMVHDWLKGIYRDAGVLLHEEGGLEMPDRNVTGHYDVLLSSQVQPVADGYEPVFAEHLTEVREMLAEHLAGFSGIVIGEIKSTSEWGMKSRRKEGPQEAHKAQLGAYWLMAQAYPSQMPATPTGARIIYVSKDSKSSILEFELEPAWVDDVDKTIDQLNEHWAAGTLPPCTCAGWSIGYCDYLKPEARTFQGKPKSNVVGGVDCCPPELFNRP